VQTEPPPLDAPAIFAILDAHHVEHVVVVGYAAQLHGSTRVAMAVDVTRRDCGEPRPARFRVLIAALADVIRSKTAASSGPLLDVRKL